MGFDVLTTNTSPLDPLLASGDLRGGSNKILKILKKRNVGRTLLFALFKKAFLWLWASQKREKNQYFCVMFNR